MTSDEKIISLFNERSEDGLKLLDKEYGAKLRAFAKRILSDDGLAEEVINDTYIALWNRIPPERPTPLYPYIFRMLRNISIRRYRSESAEKRCSRYDLTMSEIEAVLSVQDSPEDILTAAELRSHIEEFLDKQSPENRVVFIRRYLYLDSYAEIAKRVSLTEKTVSVRLVRLRGALKKHLIKKGDINER